MREDARHGSAARRRALLALSLACGLAACQQPVYQNLGEDEANQVLLTLLKGGIAADKRSVEGKNFSVWVDDSRMAAAIELLNANAKPAQQYQSLGDIFARHGLVSSPNEERIRFIYGVEQSIAKTLAQIDGVQVARVHVVLPTADPLSTQAKPTSASVFLKHRADMDMQVVLPAVKELVVRSVEGLAADRVAVTFFPSRTALTPVGQQPVTRFFGAIVASSSLPLLWGLVILPWLVVVVLLFLLARSTRLREALQRWLALRAQQARAAAANEEAA
jgi:type III secretion protein J